MPGLQCSTLASWCLLTVAETGEITRIQHDAGIVFARRPFVLMILTRGIENPKPGSALIAAITRQCTERPNETQGRQ